MNHIQSIETIQNALPLADFGLWLDCVLTGAIIGGAVFLLGGFLLFPLRNLARRIGTRLSGGEPRAGINAPGRWLGLAAATLWIAAIGTFAIQTGITGTLAAQRTQWDETVGILAEVLDGTRRINSLQTELVTKLVTISSYRIEGTFNGQPIRTELPPVSIQKENLETLQKKVFGPNGIALTAPEAEAPPRS